MERGNLKGKLHDPAACTWDMLMEGHPEVITGAENYDILIEVTFFSPFYFL